ncbi:MAG: hypothetical protein GY791_05690 [Alphaproteobacteria bacterium]|nr:hypothetical protein [Alphaproteobacteria bacterium]
MATTAAQEILGFEGNAIDATVAAQAVLSVVTPEACGLGGDGLFLIRDPEGDSYGRERRGCCRCVQTGDGRSSRRQQRHGSGCRRRMGIAERAVGEFVPWCRARPGHRAGARWLSVGEQRCQIGGCPA